MTFTLKNKAHTVKSFLSVSAQCDIDSDEAVASIPNMDNEAFKKMIQREMRLCMLETFNQVMSSKRSFPIENQDITEGLSSHTSDDLIEIRGKRRKKK